MEDTGRLVGTDVVRRVSISPKAKAYPQTMTAVDPHKVILTKRRSAKTEWLSMLLVSSLTACMAQRAPVVSNTPPRQQFVAVSPDVKLEVMDWGGSGRNLVLLAGGGNTAHVFAILAPKLAKHFHVYGITRRGAGVSSSPSSGYTARRSGDDVVAVLDALSLTDPVLIGHSIAGQEMSAVSKYHPGRAAALVYLDAGGPFALYNPEHGDIDTDRVELQEDLSRLAHNEFDDATIVKTLADETRYRRNLQDLRDEVEGAESPSPTQSDRSSIATFQKYFVGYYGGILPEDEIRQLYEITADGAVGARMVHPSAKRVHEFDKEQFSSVDTRALVIVPYPNALSIGVTHDPAKLAAYKAQEASRKQGQLEIWHKQRKAEIVVIPNATHYIFLSDEAEILSLISRFVDGLPKSETPR
ncbi:alpha/beta hydrolase [Granulicella sp. dw_53]|uniref:alpha/beta hydrolase n=1 Tax=Granulicella sp. dw_53 TaxID=2719792 RepID=UPI001BD1E24E|nr:alpha/beta hydrolase [Granulicella sp. dw_53]